MIFTKLFSSKASWQHKEASVRVNSIENELNLAIEQEKQIIVQLATQDDSDLVRRAALLKLDDIELWLTLGLNDAVSSIVKLAEKKLTEVFSQDERLTVEQKLALLPRLPKAIAEQAIALSNDAEVLIAYSTQDIKAHQKLHLFAQKQNPQFQRHVIAQEQDIATLEKLLKKTKLDEIKIRIAEKLEELKQLAEKPEKLAKEVQLVLSKLLALKDASVDYQSVVEKRQVLTEQWAALQAEFDVLVEDKRAEFEQKFQTINDTLNKVFVAKEEQYQQAIIAKQAEQQQDNARQAFSLFIEQKSVELTNAIFENQTLDDSAFSQEVSAFEQEVEQSPLTAEEKSTFVDKVRSLNERMVKVDTIAHSVTNATHLISKMAQQVPPVNQSELAEKQQFFKQWLSEWKANLKQAQGILPESIINAHKEIKQSWLNALSPLEKEQHKLFSQGKRKASDVKRLLASGKYNAAFGVFNKFKRLYQDLLPELKQKLQRDFEQLSEKMAELSDWEHYIATPRKQQLLTEIQRLAAKPLDNPAEQADKVKWYRKTWNSLGHADETLDEELNEAFNQACELAFAPCRQFYAEQDKVREAHLNARKSLIDEAKALHDSLANEQIDYKVLEAAFNKLAQHWRNAGEVDRAVYKTINQEFQQLTKPIKQALNNYHNDNVVLKKQIIDKATQLTEEADVFKAVEEVKALQQAWKKIGYAGIKNENSLWREFRKTNDVIFSRRSELNEQRQKAQDLILASTTEQLQTITQSLSANQSDLKVLKEVASQAESLLASLKSEKVHSKELQAKITQVVGDVKQQIAQLKSESKRANWLALFEVLEQLARQAVTAEELASCNAYQQLSNGFTKKLNESLSTKPAIDRHQATLALEIIAGAESPSEDNDQRMALQVEMMQQKMNSGHIESVEEKLWQWLALGRLTEVDLPFIERVKKSVIS